MPSVLVWDLETIPDLYGFACANGLSGQNLQDVRKEMGDKFPKHIYHSIVCIGAVIAHFESDRWIVDAIGAPHVGERLEKELISAFVDRIAELTPQLITFNGASFDLHSLYGLNATAPSLWIASCAITHYLQSSSTGGRKMVISCSM